MTRRRKSLGRGKYNNPVDDEAKAGEELATSEKVRKTQKSQRRRQKSPDERERGF